MKHRYTLLTAFALLCSLSTISLSIEDAPEPEYEVVHIKNICIDSGDIDTEHNRPGKICEEGTEDGDKLLLTANYFQPIQTDPDSATTFPAIIFINAWTVNDKSYSAIAAEYAKKGYIAISYGTRGFGNSDGTIHTAGPKDTNDLSTVIDWLQSNTDIPWDGTNLGVAGISYGGGIGLLGSAKDPRITAVASLSGWADLIEALWGGETTNVEWTYILMGSGGLLGRLDPELIRMHADMKAYANVEDVLAWGAERSVINNIDNLNHHPERAAPLAIFLSNNWNDYLFQPNTTMRLFAALDTPKILRVNKGIHGTASGGGLAGAENSVWTEVDRFFDLYLKGIETGIDEEPPVSFALQGTSKRHYYDDWPLPLSVASTRLFYLAPRPELINSFDFQVGRLSTIANNIVNDVDSISSARDTKASLGPLPVAAAFAQSFNITTRETISNINPDYGIVYQTQPFEETVHIRGIPSLDVWIKPSANTASLIAYLYDVKHKDSDDDEYGVGTLITHGPVTLHNINGDPSAVDSGLTDPVKASITFIATSYDIEEGHNLVLAIDTVDPEYQRYNRDTYTIEFVYSADKQSILYLPTAISSPDGLPLPPEEEVIEITDSDSARGLNSGDGGGSSSSGTLGSVSLMLLLVIGRLRRETKHSTSNHSDIVAIESGRSLM